MNYVYAVIFVIGAYLLGNLNFAYILVKWLTGDDVRNYGSGNAGTTNVLRVMGKKAALTVFALDALKGVAVIAIGRLIGMPDLWLAIGGIAVIAGHNWPVFLQFRGGKGTATSLGVFLCYDWQVALIAIAVGIIILLLFRMVSLTSMVGILAVPVAALFLGRPAVEIVLGFILLLMSVFQHRANIGRILKGKEGKIGEKAKRMPGSTTKRKKVAVPRENVNEDKETPEVTAKELNVNEDAKSEPEKTEMTENEINENEELIVDKVSLQC
jgi:glycerol-3-phosphate acyltransferase PlsY